MTLPDPPVHLGPVALEEWSRIAPELHRIGVLTIADRTTMAAYCQLYEQWVYAEKYIKDQLVIVDKPTGRIVQNPMIRISHRTLDLLRGYMVELGLTPSSRTRIKAQQPGQKDELEAFLKQGKRKPQP